MLTVQSREKARFIGATLNKIAGKKRFIQARNKTSCGSWGIVRKDGILRLPLECPPRQAPVTQFISGVLVTAKNARTVLH